MNYAACLALGICLFFPVFAAESLETSKPSLGKIHFPTSANKEAQAHFLRGVLFLHNFEYPCARAAFEQAATADPDFALAYWGEAMSYNYPLWNGQDLIDARKALEKLAKTSHERIAKANTEKEKKLMQAVNQLFGEGSKRKRDASYAASMERLYREYPQDDEIALLYALALLGQTEGTRDYQAYIQAAAIAEDVQEHNPQHPGAMHYAIHAYDDPLHAPLGLRAARRYAKIAPDASHALHMPSHIFLALGMWDDVIASNTIAWNASKKKHSECPASPDLHALQWLVYGHLQKQQYKQAYPLVKEMLSIAEKSPTAVSKSHYALIKGAYLIESGDWNSNLKQLDMQEMDPISRSNALYIDALQALKQHQDPAKISLYVDALEKISQEPRGHEKNIDHLTLNTDDSVLIPQIYVLELRAHIKREQKELQEAIDLMRQAVILADKLPVSYGPPVPLKPAHELLADLLFEKGLYLQAYEEYIKALKLAPDRVLSNQGLKATAEKLQEQGQAVPEGIKPYFHQLMIYKS